MPMIWALHFLLSKAFYPLVLNPFLFTNSFMQTNTSIIQCPNCSLQECHVDFYPDTNQEHIQCYACGYFKFLLHENGEGKNTQKIMQQIQWPFGALKFCAKNQPTPTVLSLESEV